MLTIPLYRNNIHFNLAKKQGFVSCRQVKCQAATVETLQDTKTIATEQARKSAFYSSEELLQKVECQIEGELPTWLQGNFYRNGPGEFNEEMTHWFAGYSMIMNIQFKNGKAYQQQRKIETESYKAYLKNGNKMQFSEFGSPVTLFKNVVNIFKLLTGLGQGITDNSAVTVTALDNDRLLAFTETVNGAHVLNADNLEVIKAVKYKDDIKGFVTTAHGTQLKNGTFINIVHDISGGYQIVKWKPLDEKRELIRKISPELSNTNCWIHDFPITEKYVVLPETPIYYDITFDEKTCESEYVIGPWKPELESIFQIVPLNGKGSILKIKLPAFFTFHYINAFEFKNEQGLDCIAVDFCHYNTAAAIGNLKLKNLRGAGPDILPSTYKRISFPLQQNTLDVKFEDLISLKNCDYVELPTINSSYRGQKYRYAYGIGIVRPSNIANMIQKFDIQAGEVVQKYHEEGGIMGEPLFVANPQSFDEDDGVVLSLSTDKYGDTYMLVFDAKNFQVISKIKMETPVTQGFHTCFKFN